MSSKSIRIPWDNKAFRPALQDKAVTSPSDNEADKDNAAWVSDKVELRKGG